MLRTTIVLWALLATAVAVAGVPENPRLRVIGVADGLPSSNINGLVLDRSGYLWLATSDGLARHDGVGMQVWRHQPGDPAALPGNYLSAVHVDGKDRVWVAIEGRGLSVLDRSRQAFRHYRKGSSANFGSDDVWAITSLGDDLWFGTFGGGLHRLSGAADDDTGRITRFMPVAGDPRSLPADIVLALGVDDRGQLWTGTTAGLARWTGSDFERVPLPGTESAPTIYSVSADGAALWVGASTGLFRREADGRWTRPAWAAMFETPNAVFSVVPEPGGELWIASQRKLWRVAPGDVPVPVSIGAHGPVLPMYQILRQANGALWFPVAGRGLGYLRPDWRRIAQFSRSDDGLAGELYRGLAPASEGGVWLAGSRGELERLAPDGAVVPVDPRVQERLAGGKPMSIAEDRHGQVWIGERRGLVRVGRNGEVRAWREDGVDGVLGGPIDLMRLAPDGTLWLSAAGAGIQQRDVTSGKVLTTILAGDAQGLGAGDIEAMAFDSGGRLWIAGEHGLARWDAAADRFAPVPGIPTGDRVFAFAFDGRDALWLQRLSGLERHARRGGGWRRVTHAGVAEGIPGVEGSGLLVDAGGRVWLPSSRGLFRWDPSTRRVRHFGLADGLGSQEFVDRALTLTPDGVIAAALADGGIVLLDTRAEDPLPQRPALHWDRVEVRRDGGWLSRASGSPLTLTPSDHELRVQLRLLAFEDAKAHRYFTRLDGYDRAWVAHGTSGERVFAGLPAGRHVLRARAIDAAGNAAPEQQLRFSVQPPWWRTGPARVGFAAALLLLALAAAAAYRARLRRRLDWQRAEHARAVSHEASLAKTRFLATLGHEVRTPMTGVLGMSELLLGTALDPQQRGYTESIRGAGEHLLRLVNDALDLARIESGKLELSLQPFDLRALVDGVVALTAPLARQRGLAFACEVAPETPVAVLGDATRVRQILLNLIGNAVKFTEIGGIRVRVSPQLSDPGDGTDDRVLFEVADTGPGLNPEQQSRLFRRFEQAEGNRTADRYGGSGLGLAICQELAAAMGGSISVTSEPGAGACFSVVLPLSATALSMPEPSTVAGAAAKPASSLALLLVEDDPTVAEVVSGLLQAQGHRVTHAAHGLAAMAEVATVSFDAALLDLDLPGIDGFALARQLRSQNFAGRLVAITARADADAEPQARDAGFDAFVRKPVTGAILAALLEDAGRRMG